MKYTLIRDADFSGNKVAVISAEDKVDWAYSIVEYTMHYL